jgi:hypothetical protein
MQNRNNFIRIRLGFHPSLRYLRSLLFNSGSICALAMQLRRKRPAREGFRSCAKRSSFRTFHVRARLIQLHGCGLRLPRRLGGVLPNRATSETFRDVARCSAMSHHVALCSLHAKSAGLFNIPRTAARSTCNLPLRSLCCLLFNSGPMCAHCVRTRIWRAPSRDKCAFRSGDVRQCAVMSAIFSRARACLVVPLMTFALLIVPGNTKLRI